jgi:suppressor of ftsI
MSRTVGELGAVEDWTSKNQDEQQHPFHIHVNDVQTMSINAVPYDAVGFQYTVNVPALGRL